MTARDKDLTIGTIKGLAIGLVVMGHVIQRSVLATGGDFFLNPVFKVIYTFHMPLFVFMSGYLMALSLNRKKVSDVFASRCKSLLVPYLSWGVLGVITTYLLAVVDSKNAGPANFMTDFGDQLLVHPAVWFLFTLFVVSGVLLVSVTLEKRFGRSIFAIIYLLILVIPGNENYSLYYIKWFYPFYAAGYLFKRYNIHFESRANGMIVQFAVLVLFAVLAGFWDKSDYIYLNKMCLASSHYFYEISRFAYRYLIGFLGIALAFALAGHLARTRIGYFWDRIGTYSLDIYLVQRYIVEGLFLRVLNAFHFNLSDKTPLAFYAFIVLMTVVFTGLCLFVSLQLIRKNAVLNRLLLGGRAG